MKYAILFLTLFTASAAFADHGANNYLLTRSDAENLLGYFQAALTGSPDNRAIDWRNPATGLSGSTVPIRSYRSTAGQLCRDYMSMLQLDGATQQAFGTACQRADGSWKIAAEKLVERPGSVLRFVYHRQLMKDNKGCPVRSQQQPTGRFHSDRFHEEIRNFIKQQRQRQQVQPVERQAPSRLLKLVAY